MNISTLAPVDLDCLKRLRRWHELHKRDKPRELQLFNAVLTVWMMGCVGWLPALVLGTWWALPLCAVAAEAPLLYVRARSRAHAAGRLRCDWLGLLR